MSERLYSIVDVGTQCDPRQEFDDSCYRRGYCHGIVAAVELMRAMYCKGGYVRPTEIANVIEKFAYGPVMRWRYIQPSDEEIFPPECQWSTWADVRRKIIDRDGGACARCGAQKELEVHHIVPVNDGGTPDDENLCCLCAECHKAV